jgi:hypothetical protein
MGANSTMGMGMVRRPRCPEIMSRKISVVAATANPRKTVARLNVACSAGQGKLFGPTDLVSRKAAARKTSCPDPISREASSGSEGTGSRWDHRQDRTDRGRKRSKQATPSPASQPMPFLTVRRMARACAPADEPWLAAVSLTHHANARDGPRAMAERKGTARSPPRLSLALPVRRACHCLKDIEGRLQDCCRCMNFR